MSKSLNVNIVNPFLNAVIDVLTTMAQVVPTPGRPFLKESSQAIGDVTGIIGLTGHDDKGSISVTFTESCALVIVSNLLGEEIKELTADVRDAVGELTNMIAGQARRGLDEVGHKYHAAIPTVVVGRKHTIEHHATGPILAIPFKTPHGDITVEACFGELGV